MSARRAAIGAALLLLGTVAAGLLAGSGEHAAPAWRALPAFDFGYGLVGCLAIVLVSKALGRLGLQKPEGWDEPDPGEDP